MMEQKDVRKDGYIYTIRILKDLCSLSCSKLWVYNGEFNYDFRCSLFSKRLAFSDKHLFVRPKRCRDCQEQER